MAHALLSQMLRPDEQIRDSSVCVVVRWLDSSSIKTNEPRDAISATGQREHSVK